EFDVLERRPAAPGVDDPKRGEDLLGFAPTPAHRPRHGGEHTVALARVDDVVDLRRKLASVVARLAQFIPKTDGRGQRVEVVLAGEQNLARPACENADLVDRGME